MDQRKVAHTGYIKSNHHFVVDWKNEQVAISNDDVLICSHEHIKKLRRQINLDYYADKDFDYIIYVDLETESLITCKNGNDILPRLKEVYINIVSVKDALKNNFFQRQRIYLESITKPNDLIEFHFISSLVHMVETCNGTSVICAYNGVSFDFKYIFSMAWKYKFDISHFNFIDPFLYYLENNYCFINGAKTKQLTKQLEKLPPQDEICEKTSIRKINEHLIRKSTTAGRKEYIEHLKDLVSSTHSPDSDIEMTFIAMYNNFNTKRYIPYYEILNFYKMVNSKLIMKNGIDKFENEIIQTTYNLK